MKEGHAELPGKMPHNWCQMRFSAFRHFPPVLEETICGLFITLIKLEILIRRDESGNPAGALDVL
jgi:hypothetical protein